MIPHDDLLRALVDWRARQGLPPLHALDYLGALKQPRIDTSRAIAAVTGSLELLDVEAAGGDYDYDEPLAPPPMDQPVSTGWSDYDAAAAQTGSADQILDTGYDYEQPQPSYAEPEGYEQQAPEGYEQQGYDYEQPQSAFDIHSVGDSTAIYNDLLPSQAAQGYAPVPTDPNLPAIPSYGFDDDDDEGESTMIGAMPGRPPLASSQAATPPSSEATAIFDTSLATQAAEQVEAASGHRGGGVPSEPVYDSIAAAAEYQAERVAEENAAFDDELDEHTYVPAAFYGEQEPAAADYPPAQPDHRPTQLHEVELAPADEPPPLEPPPGLPSDDGFEIHFDDD